MAGGASPVRAKVGASSIKQTMIERMRGTRADDNNIAEKLALRSYGLMSNSRVNVVYRFF